MIEPNVTAESTLPSIPEPNANNVVDVLRILKEIIQVRETDVGDPLDRSVTYRHLYQNGLLNTSFLSGAQYVRLPGFDTVSLLPQVVQDGTEFTQPPAPAGFSAVGAMANVILQWDKPAYNNHAYTEVWRAAVDDLSMAVRISTPDTNVAADNLGDTGITRYYWIRHVSKANIGGPFNAVPGTSATTGFVGTDNIANLAVTNAKIALLAVDTANIVNLAVVTAKIADLSVTSAKIALLAVTTALIDNAAITTAKIANLAVTSAQIANATITAAQIANATITGSLIVSGTITGTLIAASTITASNLSVSTLSAITADLGTITAGSITLNSTGYIKGGQSAYNTGTGFFLGYSGGAYKLSLGDASANYMTWDGSALSIRGNFYGVSYIAGSTLISSADTERGPGTGIVKSIQVARDGTLRVKFDLKTDNPGFGAVSQIYKNGSSFGTVQSTLSTTYTTYTEDIAVSAGDYIQLYADTHSIIRNFRIYNGYPVAESVVTD